jgi:hypothetical protein
MQIKQETITRINETMAAKAAAETGLREAEAALLAKQELCRDDVEELEVLKRTAEPGDKKAVQQLTILQARIPLFDRPISEAEGVVKSARASLDFQKRQVCAALREAGTEVAAERFKIARSALAPLTDDSKFIDSVVPRLSTVSDATRFVGFCVEGSVEQNLALPLDKIAEFLLAGKLPPIPRPDPNELATVLRSMTADASLRY